MTRRLRGRAIRALALAFSVGGLSSPTAGRAQPLVADLSNHLVAITAGFTGTDVVVFGTTDGPGDVVVAISGPRRPTLVRRKSRLVGIWVNRESMLLADVPNYYGYATSRPLDKILAPQLLERHQIGVENLRLLPPNPEVRRDDIPEFREALIRNRQRDNLFSKEPGKVTFLGERLFRVRMAIPANVATGAYAVQVYLIRDGQVASAQTTPLLISKIGVGAEIFAFAHRQSLIYGIIAVVLAVGAGWLAGIAFRRV
jgi:uncharacterized protein (TIGR02186 family)